MSTNQQKPLKDSKQVRVDLQTHKQLKIAAAERGLSLIRLVAQICSKILPKK
jgi:predicted HicB family RNase H-like nuclease